MADTLFTIAFFAALFGLVALVGHCERGRADHHVVVEQCTAAVQHTKYKQRKDLDDEEIPWRHAIRVYSYEYRQGTGFFVAHADLPEGQARAMCAEEKKR